MVLARHFREFEGLSIAQIGDRLGRSPATVKAYFYDPTGEKAKVVKARYPGVCRGCSVAGLVASHGDPPRGFGRPAVNSRPARTKPAAVRATVLADELSASAEAATISLRPGWAHRRTIALPPLARAGVAIAFCCAGGSPGMARRRSLTRDPSVVTRMVPRIATPTGSPPLCLWLP